MPDSAVAHEEAPCTVSASRLYNLIYVIDIEPMAHVPWNKVGNMAKGNNSQNKDKKKAKAAAPKKDAKAPAKKDAPPPKKKA